jgi:membrane protease YdiL (CAAX protease family)
MDWIYFIGVLSEWLGVLATTWILLLSARFRKRPVIFKYQRREGNITLLLSAFIILVAALAFRNLIQLPVLPVPASLNALGLRTVLGLIALLLFTVVLLMRGQPLLSAGWGRANLSPAFQLGLGLAIITIFLRGKTTGILNGLASEEALSLLLCAALALSEESIFRGFVQLRLSGWWGEIAGLLGTALLWIFWQIPRLMLYPEQFWFLLLLTTGQALVLGWVAQKSGHSLPVTMYRAVSEWILYIV